MLRDKSYCVNTKTTNFYLSEYMCYETYNAKGNTANTSLVELDMTWYAIFKLFKYNKTV